jgi:endonuclease YncB( thermonuclease family)
MILDRLNKLPNQAQFIRRSNPYIKLLLVLILSSLYFMPAAQAANTVASIYDGDTLTLNNGAKVRLLQIDTPELSSSECYGQEAKQALIKLIGKSKITLESDSASADRDRYGRYLRYVIVGKKNLNLELVKIGAAAPYFYQGEKGKYSTELLKAAERAKSKKLGLWGQCAKTQLIPTKALDTKN